MILWALRVPGSGSPYCPAISGRPRPPGGSWRRWEWHPPSAYPACWARSGEAGARWRSQHQHDRDTSGGRAVGGRGQQRTSGGGRRPVRGMAWAVRRLLPGHVRHPLAPVRVEAGRPHPHLQPGQQPRHPRQPRRRVHPVRHGRLVRDHLLGHGRGQLHVRQLQGRRCAGRQLERLERVRTSCDSADAPLPGVGRVRGDGLCPQRQPAGVLLGRQLRRRTRHGTSGAATDSGTPVAVQGL
jgi:hypothetical protein